MRFNLCYIPFASLRTSNSFLNKVPKYKIAFVVNCLWNVQWLNYALKMFIYCIQVSSASHLTSTSANT